MTLIPWPVRALALCVAALVEGLARGQPPAPPTEAPMPDYDIAAAQAGLRARYEALPAILDGQARLLVLPLMSCGCRARIVSPETLAGMLAAIAAEHTTTTSAPPEPR